MSTEINEREKQLARREGFVEGVGLAHADYNAVRLSKQDRGLYAWMEQIGAAGLRSHLVKARAAERYPLPKIERPRVVSDPSLSVEWRCDPSGELSFRFTASRCWTFAENWSHGVTAARIAVWNDLRETPTELVEDVHPPLDDMERR